MKPAFDMKAMPDDPLPWFTPRLEGVVGKPLKDLTPEDAVILQDHLSSIVSGMQDDGKPYSVTFGDPGIASTSFAGAVTVGVLPLLDPTLTVGQKAAIFLGAMTHEVGHIKHLRKWDAEVMRDYPGDVKVTGSKSWAGHLVTNLASDLHDEFMVRDEFVGYADSLDVLLWFTGRKGEAYPGLVPSLETADDRWEAAILATRAPWVVPDWNDNPALAAWLEAWEAWKAGCEADLDLTTMKSLVKRGVKMILNGLPEVPDEPKGSEKGEGKGGDGDGEAEGEGEGEGEGKGQGKGEGKDGDGKGDASEGSEDESTLSKPGEGNDSPKGENKPTKGSHNIDGEAGMNTSGSRGAGGTTQKGSVAGVKADPLAATATIGQAQEGLLNRQAASVRKQREGKLARRYKVWMGDKEYSLSVTEEKV